MLLLNFREPVSAWTHGLWLLLSVPGTLLLWKASGGDRARRISLLVFGISLAFCYAGSTLYHGVRLSGEWLDRFDRLDHVGIYVLIAGSYTPMAWNLLSGVWKWGILGSAWLSCLAGTATLLMRGIAPPGVSTAIYMVMGWGAVLCCAEVARAASLRALRLLILGGVLYTVGAVINVAGWPNLWPGVVGPHEIFHLFVMAGTLAHFCFMLKFVARAATTNQPEDRWERVVLKEPRPRLAFIPNRLGR